MEQQVEFRSFSTRTLLRGRFIKPEKQDGQLPLVFMITGDGPKGTKSLSWVNMPPKLVDKGIASFLFDFEGLGYSDGDRKKLSLTVGLDNLRSAYNFINGQDWINKSRIGSFSSSFGSAVLLLESNIANEFKINGFKSPAPFLPDAYVNEIGDASFDEWRKTGYSEANGYEFAIFLDALRYNPYESAQQIKTPCLITHGDKDEIASLRQSKYLFECFKGEKRMEIFEGGSHGYSEEGAWDRMAKMFVDWFAERL